MIKPRPLPVCISILISFFRRRRFWALAATATAFIVLCASQPALTHPALAAADLPIYTDALAGGWQDWSWDTTRSFDNAQPVHSGSASIAITYTAAWAGFYLTDTALPASDYTAIRFWVHGGSTGGQSVNFHLNDGGESYPFTVQANTWLSVTVPFAALGNPTTLSALVWQDGSGNDLGQPTFYLDDISLIGPTPLAGVNLSGRTNGVSPGWLSLCGDSRSDDDDPSHHLHVAIHRSDACHPHQQQLDRHRYLYLDDTWP